MIHASERIATSMFTTLTGIDSAHFRAYAPRIGHAGPLW
jgi:hypothetical protein